MKFGLASCCPASALNSNFGSRIDCYAWGDGVDTCVSNGPGDRASFAPPCFLNTSAAAAIIAGAALCVQGMREHRQRIRFSPKELRDILSDATLGAPGTNGLIGVMPDLQRISAAI